MRSPTPNYRARCIGVLAATVSVFAVATGAAFADPGSHPSNYFALVAVGTRPDDRAGLHGPNAPAFATAPAAVRPDDRAGIRGAGPSLPLNAHVQIAAVRPDDRAGIHGIGVPEVASAATTTSSGSGFHWQDAGIGAGATVALILIAGGVFLVAGRRHGSSPSALHG